MKIRDCELKIVKGTIKNLSVDAVVLGVKDKPLGESKVAKTGDFKAKYAVYASVIGTDSRDQETILRLGYRSAFQHANKLRLKTAAFLIPEGLTDFPLVGLAKILTQEVLRYLREHHTTLKKILFLAFDQKTFAVVDKTVRGYVEHILYKFTEGPFVTVDAIIEYQNGIVLIARSNPPYGLALPGGFVDYGESLEEAVCREAKEETNLKLVGLRQFHTYSKPDRDPRFHTIGTVFTAQGMGRAKSGDDAADLRVVPAKDLLKLKYAFDHKEVIKDYLKSRKK